MCVCVCFGEGRSNQQVMEGRGEQISCVVVPNSRKETSIVV